jgi:phytoene dehydrogenase-like protein
VDPGMVIHLSTGEVITYHQDFEAWMGELETHFPDLPHRKFWTKVFEIDRLGWELLGEMGKFPSFDPTDFFFIFKHPRFFKILPNFLISTEMALKFYGLDRPRYLELVNGILLISAQETAEHIPFLVGALSLAYPRETYIPEGGMKGLMDFFEAEFLHRGIDLRKKTKVVSGTQSEVLLESGERISADQIIYNTPIWNTKKIRGLAPEEKLPGSWGAFTVYLGIKKNLEHPYQQVHLNHPLVKNYFVSYREGAVTISTHVRALDWFGLTGVEYDRLKETHEKIILDDFFKRFGIEDAKFITAGTPSTFEFYTGRESGFVGGLPFLYGKNPWRLPNFETDEANVFQVGDTTFPGQGLVGVVSSALALDKFLRK